MLVNLNGLPCIRDALALPAGRAAAEDRPLAAWGSADAFGPPPIATAYGTLLNHRDALAALGDAVHQPPHKAPPKAPVLYIKPRHCLAGHGAEVEVPADAQAVEVGAQLGIVIGAEACRVREADALAHVAGYTICSDLSVPHPSYYRPSLRYKARDGFLPLGPWIVGTRHVPRPDALEVVVEIDGREAQRYSTAGMQRGVATDRRCHGLHDAVAGRPADAGRRRGDRGARRTDGADHDRPIGTLFLAGGRPRHEARTHRLGWRGASPSPTGTGASRRRHALAEDEVVWLPPVLPGTIIALGINGRYRKELAKELTLAPRTSRWPS